MAYDGYEVPAAMVLVIVVMFLVVTIVFVIVRVTPGDPKELVERPEQLDAALTDAVERAVRENGAEAVIMGGGPLSAPAMRIQSRFDVPLVVAVTAATNAAMTELSKKIRPNLP